MKIHFIGIGGIGTSALARYYLSQGDDVQGTDIELSEVTNLLKKEGISVKIGPQKASNINDNIDLVIRSAAVPDDNPEVKEAKKRKIAVKEYAEVLGEISKKYYTICVAGTHGKTTTTAMLSLILIKAGLDPTVIVGTNLKEFGKKNFYKGSSKAPRNFRKPLLILEADEWQASFLNYKPDALILTNIDEEHLDYYRNFEHIIETFRNFIKQIKPNGLLILNHDNKGISKLNISKLRPDIKSSFYSIKHGAKKIKAALQIPGKHNLSDALAAYTLARAIGVDSETCLETLGLYKGAWRRLETKRIIFSSPQRKITIINDYAHHPTEIQATLEAIRERYGKQVLWTIFQPHQRQRTYYLFDKLTKCFDQTDYLILAKIYDVAGREKNGDRIKSEDLAIAIKGRWQKLGFNKKIVNFNSFSQITAYIKDNISNKAVLAILGAGDIYKINKELK